MSDEKSEFNFGEQEPVIVIDFEQVEQVSKVFFEEAKEILEDLDELILRLENDPTNIDQINLLFRKVHTIKGSVGAVPGGQLLGSLAHEFEALLTRIKREERPVTKECVDLFLKSSRIIKVLAQSLRDKRELYPEELSEAIELISSYGGFEFLDGHVAPEKSASRVPAAVEAQSSDDGVWLSSKQMNEFLKLSGELLVLKNFFQMMNQTVNFRIQPELFERRQVDFSQNLAKICDVFQNQVQTVRKETASESFHGLHLIIRQASTELNKSVQWNLTGGDLPIDKSLGKDLYEAMVHLARNSIDHGVEDQFERALQGKASTGTLSLDIAEKNNTIFVTFKDDGKGLDKERILQIALKSGLVQEENVATLSDEDIYKFIFNAGFSTKEKVTTISGRGVGMDIVQHTVDKYKGRIRIENSPGQGACFKLEIPIPQHIMVESALLCTWQDYQFAVPLTSVAHISSCEELQITHVNHLRYCQFSGLTVPIMNYSEILNLKTSLNEEQVRQCAVVFMKIKDVLIAFLVDRIDAQTDLVVKPFGKVISEQRGFKGISILADEKITYIVDPEQILDLMFVGGTENRQEAA
ncbi:MAG: chemotaxis protein CheW [Bdellovibrio sp.]|nr:chemotaxis protein CheW [Bdellovibrio sp.]